MGGAIQSLGQNLLPQRWLWWLGVVVWAVTLYLLSDNSAPPTGPEFPFKDKVLHCIYFSGGAFCFVLALLGARTAASPMLRAMMYGLAFAALCGGLDEWHQSFTPGRFGNDWGDWLADCAGGLLGGTLAWQVIQRFQRASAGRSPM